MSRSIDQRIVEMRFDNAQFERGVKETSSLLDRLKDALKIGGDVNDLNKAASGFSLDGMAAGVDNISSRFSALGAIGFSVLQDLTQRAISFGGQMLSKITEPILGGGRSRALNLEQANFQFEGLGMDVEKSMESALYAVEGTAFGLDEAAVLAANFGATGMEAGQEMSDALRGVSGVASMAGASYGDIGNVFGKVAGQGRLMGDDLNRLAARGVNAAATMADQMGITESEFREMVSQGDISFQQFAEGMNEAFGDQATKANETYTGSLSNMRAALARTGAMFFSGHLTRQRDLFNAITPLINRVNNALGPLINSFGEFLNLRYENLVGFLEGLDKWETGGAILKAVREALQQFAATVMSWAGPIVAAFSQIFGGGTIADVVNFISALERFAQQFELSATQAEALQRTFAGVFAIFDIGFYVIGQVIGMLARLIGYAFEGAGGFLEFTGSIGDFLVNLRDAIKEGDLLTNVLGFIEGAIRGVIDWFGKVGGAIGTAFVAVGEFFGGMNFGFLEGAGDKLKGIFAPFESAGKAVSIVWGGVMTVLGGIWDVAAPAAMWVVDKVGEFIQTLAEVFRSDDFSKILDVVNTGLLASVVLMIKQFFDSGKEASSGGFLDSIKEMFGGVTETLTEMQNNLKADTLLKLAGAIAVLTASVLALSLVDPVKLTTALAAITVMFTQLGVALGVFSGLAVGPAVLKMPIIAAGLILLAGAIAILAIPVMMLSRLSWEELAKGLAGVAGLLLIMVPTAAVLSGLSGSFIRIGIAMIPFAAGLLIMSAALKNLSDLEWDEIGRGLTALAGALGAISVALMLIPSAAILRKGASLILLATALHILQGPLEDMGQLSWEEIGKGLATLGGSLLIMAVGLRLMAGTLLGSIALIAAAGAMNVLIGPLERMSKMGWEGIGKALTMLGGSLLVLAAGLYLMSGTLLGSAGLIVAAGAMMMLIDPLERMGRMGWDEIGKALTVLAGGLIVLAGGLYLMSGTLLGSAGLIVAAGALAILAPVLESLGNLEWQVIATGLLAMAGAFTVIGIAGLLLTPVMPTLLLLGVAMIGIGAGMAAAGAGMLLFGIGFGAVGVALATNGALFLDFIKELILLLPTLAAALAVAIADFIVTFFEESGRVILAFGQLVSDILQEIRDRAPEFRETFVVLLMNAMIAIEELTPQFQTTLVTVVLAGLETVEELAPEFASTAMVLIHRFLDTVDENIDEFIRKGVEIVDKLIIGILSHGFGIEASAVESIISFLRGTDRQSGAINGGGARVITYLVTGITGAFFRMVESGRQSITEFLGSIASQYDALKRAGAQVLAELAGGIRESIFSTAVSLGTSAREIGSSIITGIGIALDAGTGGLFTKIRQLADGIVLAAKVRLDSNSPSKVFVQIGKDIDEGWALGIEGGAKRVTNASDQLAKDSLGTVEEALRYFPDIFSGMDSQGPVIRPIVDLSDVEEKAERISSIFGDPTVDRGYNRASNIMQERAAQRQAAQETKPAAEAERIREIVINQSNTSPKALSEAEIYRQTRNLLSTTKEVLSK